MRYASLVGFALIDIFALAARAQTQPPTEEPATEESDPGHSGQAEPKQKTPGRASANPQTPSVPAYESVVTARRSEQNIVAAPRSIEVVTRRDIARMQARAAPEALKQTTGVFVQETNRGSGSPIIRGLVGPQNLIVVDGVRFNNSTFRTGPNQYLATVDPFAIKRLELVRGPSSVLYGNGAMGGVIHILTREPRSPPPHVFNGAAWVQSADLAYGARGDFADWHDKWGFLVGGGVTEFGPLRAGGGQRQPASDYLSGSWHGKVAIVPFSSLRLTAAYLGTAIRDAGRTDRLGQGDLRFYDNDDHLAYMRADWHSAGFLKHLRVTASFHRTYERVDRFSCPTDDDKVIIDKPACLTLEEPALTRKRVLADDVNTVGGDLNAELRFLDERLVIRAGAEGYFDFVASRLKDARASEGFVVQKKARGNFSNGSRYWTVGTYVHGEGTVLAFGEDNGRLVVSAGGRFSGFGASAPEVPQLGDVTYDFFGFVGSAGVQLLLWDWVNLYGSFVQGFRAPNLQETTVLGDTGSKFEVPNGDLGPERSDTVEVGAKAKLGPLAANLAWFWSGIAGAIDEEPALFNGESEVEGKPVIRRVNAKKGEYLGIEGGISVDWWRVTATAGLTWLEGTVTDGDGETTAARRVPPVFGTAALRYAHPGQKAYVEFFVNWAARQNRLHPSDEKDLRICETSLHSGTLADNCQGTPGWVTLNLRVGWRFSEALSLDLAAMNLTDQRYRLHGSGFFAAGFDARATVTTRF